MGPQIIMVTLEARLMELPSSLIPEEKEKGIL
jgi:hypothetical protein